MSLRYLVQTISKVHGQWTDTQKAHIETGTFLLPSPGNELNSCPPSYYLFLLPGSAATDSEDTDTHTDEH